MSYSNHKYFVWKFLNDNVVWETSEYESFSAFLSCFAWHIGKWNNVCFE